MNQTYTGISQGITGCWGKNVYSLTGLYKSPHDCLAHPFFFSADPFQGLRQVGGRLHSGYVARHACLWIVEGVPAEHPCRYSENIVRILVCSSYHQWSLDGCRLVCRVVWLNCTLITSHGYWSSVCKATISLWHSMQIFLQNKININCNKRLKDNLAASRKLNLNCHNV